MFRSPIRSLFVGIGSPHGNDCLGWIVADELARRQTEFSASADVRFAKIPADLFDWMDGYERLILCDACRMGTAKGTIFRWEWPDEAIEGLVTGGSHDWNLAAVLKLAGHLGRLPEQVIVWGMEVGEELTRVESTLDAVVTAEVPKLVESIVAEVNCARNIPGAVATQAGA